MLFLSAIEQPSHFLDWRNPASSWDPWEGREKDEPPSAHTGGVLLSFLIAVIKGFDKCNLEENESQCEETVHHGAEVKVLEV